MGRTWYRQPTYGTVQKLGRYLSIAFPGDGEATPGECGAVQAVTTGSFVPQLAQFRETIPQSLRIVVAQLADIDVLKRTRIEIGIGSSSQVAPHQRQRARWWRCGLSGDEGAALAVEDESQPASSASSRKPTNETRQMVLHPNGHAVGDRITISAPGGDHSDHETHKPATATNSMSSWLEVWPSSDGQSQPASEYRPGEPQSPLKQQPDHRDRTASARSPIRPAPGKDLTRPRTPARRIAISRRRSLDWSTRQRASR